MKVSEALIMAVDALQTVCRQKYTPQKDAARLGFEFGIKAKKHWDRYQEAIRILQILAQAHDDD